ncbi:MAG: SpoIIE family protein phosphatase [Deltaproteobacteria bacterium]|nr:SpoIIE family protein phosphatase [Deltaproteobacteria bacterium]
MIQKKNNSKEKKFKFRIMSKMLVALLGLCITALLVSGYIALKNIKDIRQYAIGSSTSLGKSAIKDSASALEALGENILEQKARDVALQCEIYIKLHPDLTIADLQANPAFQDIAVQSIGTKGYTILYEKKTGIMRFHRNSAFVDFEPRQLSTKLPSFWNIYQSTLAGSSRGGYYNWRDPDGKIRQKFMYMTPVKNTNYMVAATTYIDEFSQPVKETQKKISTAAVNISKHIDDRITQTRNTFTNFFVILIVFVVFLSIFLSRMMTLPILTLIDGVKALGRGELEHKVALKTNDEFEELADSFNKMTSDLADYMERLHCTTAEQERLRKELEIASGIQKNILPTSAPDIEGVELAAINIPAREVGGDFYDYVPVDTDHWGLTIADVSGKGMPAAIFMGLSRTIVRASTTGNLSAENAIKHANELICRDSRSGMFVTLFYTILDSQTKNLTYINAGHNPPLLFRKGSPDIMVLEAKGIPLGVTENIDIEEQRVHLVSGDYLVLYTDGVTEAMNEKEEEFGKDRLIKIVQDNTSLTAQDMLNMVQEAIITFAGTRPQFDDITLMIMKVE